MTANTLTPFTWESLQLNESVMVDNVPHFTRRSIGELLEYEHPQKAIDKILERNIYLKPYSVAVNMTATDGKKYDTEVFNPMGFLLINMESSQPKAIQLKEAIARFVYELGFKKQALPSLDQSRLTDQMIKLLALVQGKDAYVHQLALAQLKTVCEQLGKPMPKLELLGKDRGQLTLEV